MLRLLADDLSGALDSAAPFAAVRGAFPVVWSADVAQARSDVAVNSETRNADAVTAAAKIRALAPWLSAATLSFKKVDSRLRGNPVVEIAAASVGGRFRTTVVAPAFPAQGRVTRRGRQLMRQPDGHWEDAGVDIAAGLVGLGLTLESALPRPGGGVFVCDADAESDLAGIIAHRATLEPPVLWCGSAGLARALAGSDAGRRAAMAPLPRPVLLLIGSDHPATRAQIDSLGQATADVWRHVLDLPAATPASTANAALLAIVGAVARGSRPASAAVVGGETLMLLCRALGASALQVVGEVEPGVAISRLVGGAWPDVPVVSKSGGFGDPGLLTRVLAQSVPRSRDA